MELRISIGDKENESQLVGGAICVVCVRMCVYAPQSDETKQEHRFKTGFPRKQTNRQTKETELKTKITRYSESYFNSNMRVLWFRQ